MKAVTRVTEAMLSGRSDPDRKKADKLKVVNSICQLNFLFLLDSPFSISDAEVIYWSLSDLTMTRAPERLGRLPTHSSWKPGTDAVAQLFKLRRQLCLHSPRIKVTEARKHSTSLGAQGEKFRHGPILTSELAQWLHNGRQLT